MNIGECEHCHRPSTVLHPVVHPSSGAKALCSQCVLEISLLKSFGNSMNLKRDSEKAIPVVPTSGRKKA